MSQPHDQPGSPTAFSKMSVIALTYNQADSLRFLLDALAAQVDPPPFEVVVTDDGSDCDNPRIIAEAAQNLDVRYVWQPDRGFRAARARNNGIRESTGDLLLFLDGDIVIPPTFLRAHLALHDGSKKVVCGRRRHVLRKPGILGTYGDALLETLKEASHEADAAQGFWSEGPYAWMAMNSFAFSVPRHEDVCFDERIEGWGSEDRELALRLFLSHGYRFVLPRQVEPVFHLVAPEVTSRHEAIASAIRNKLYVLAKHGRDEAAPILEVMRFWKLDGDTGKWTTTTTPRPETIDDILAEASSWLGRAS
jgi:glycosyltransferase involved in cell wall biosynthesis